MIGSIIRYVTQGMEEGLRLETQMVRGMGWGQEVKGLQTTGT